MQPKGSPSPIPDLVELRGEIYVDAAEFARLNAQREAEGRNLLLIRAIWLPAL